MSYVGWSLVGMVGYSFTALLVKLAMRDGRFSSFFVLAVSASFVVATAMIVVLIRGDLTRLSARDFLSPSAGFVYASGIALAVAVTSYFRALAMGPASIVVPIYGTFIVGGALLGILFLGEPVSARKLLGIALAMASIFLLAGSSGGR
jgi:transporter family protein